MDTPTLSRAASMVVIGLGGLLSISPVEETAELRSAGITLAIAGVPRDAVALAMGVRYRLRPATVWEVPLDTATWQPVAAPVLAFRGLIDQMRVEYGPTCRVVVKIENRLADWDRKRIRRYTDEDQQRAHPGDRFFRFVSTSAEKEIVWPAKSFFERGRG